MSILQPDEIRSLRSMTVAATHIFPPGIPLVRVDLGDQITDTKVMDQCEEYFSQMQQ
jgi:hypothetical protein